MTRTDTIRQDLAAAQEFDRTQAHRLNCGDQDALQVRIQELRDELKALEAPCPNCSGRGVSATTNDRAERTCPWCHGKGHHGA